jgi:DNA polymerase (family 10)
MQNTKIIELLRNLSLLLEIKGENPFKANAYKTAADIIETQSLDVKSLVEKKRVT